LYISQIRLKGFKSFGGSHLIELSPGFTAIVGPNGSGKSNILDAVRWCLGDNSPARLRISRQSDLLFKGSISTPPAGGAYSCIRLAESGEKCNIIRRYSPENGTSIEVDGERIRLSDLDEIKKKWNLEGDQFAFIGQGEVSETIRQRPLQRRLHLEGLFGIDKYRKNRDEANQKLISAREEMLRLETLLTELAARRDEIAPDAVKASRAKEIQNKLDISRGVFYRTQRLDLQGKLEEITRSIILTSDEYEKRSFWAHAWKNSLDISAGNISKLASIIEESKLEKSEIERKMNETGRQCFLAGTSIKNEKEKIQSLQKTNKKVSQELENLKKEKNTLTAERSGLCIDLEKLEDRCGKLELEFEDSRKQLEQTMAKRSSLNSKKDSMRSRDDQLKSSIFSEISFARNLREQIQELKKEQQELEKHIGPLLKEMEKWKKEYAQVIEKHRQVYADCQKKATKIQQLRRESLQLESLVEQLRSSVEDSAYPAGVRFLISASRLGKLPPACPVAEIFSTPRDLSRAIDSYLGGRLFWVVVDNVEEAGQCIEKLKEQQKGVVTFLPLKRCRERRPGELPGDIEGVRGWAIDLLTFEKKWEKAMRHLIGDLLIVKDFDAGKNIISRSGRFPVVTLDGDIFATSGTVSGGKTNKGPGLVAKRNELHKKEYERSAIVSSIEKLEKEYSEKTSEESRLSDNKKNLSEKCNSLESELERYHARNRSLIQQKKDLETMEKRHLSELKRKRSDRQELRRELKQVISELDSLGDIFKQEGYETSIREIKEQVRFKQEKIKSAEGIIERISRELERSTETLEMNNREISELNLSIDREKLKLHDLGLNYYQLWKKTKALESKLNKSLDVLSSEKKAYSRKEVKFQSTSSRLESNEKDLAFLNREKESLIKELSDLVDAWEDKYPFVEKMDHLVSKDPESIKKNIRKLEKELREIGDYNSGALSEKEALEKRISYLGEQMEDASSGMEELKYVIETADAQVDKVFNRALQNIDEKFNQLFQNLFGGGEAHLKRDGKESLWDSGVDIYARPPGKRLQGIAQLSGGEQSLTAISLLFASMEVAKVPVAILDEVDAALDDVNLRRFVDLVCAYSEMIQILIMTHRRTTMERSQLMYGVTLSEPGLSEIVGVRVEDWK
jgi:chromosome segregation protein